MLPKGRRVTLALFKRVVANAKNKRYHSPNLALSVTALPNGGLTRFSFVASAKFAKSAVIRNTLKRRGRSAIRGRMHDVKDGALCVFYFKAGALSLSYAELERETMSLLRQANLFSK